MDRNGQEWTRQGAQCRGTVREYESASAESASEGARAGAATAGNLAHVEPTVQTERLRRREDMIS